MLPCPFVLSTHNSPPKLLSLFQGPLSYGKRGVTIVWVVVEGELRGKDPEAGTGRQERLDPLGGLAHLVAVLVRGQFWGLGSPTFLELFCINIRWCNDLCVKVDEGRKPRVLSRGFRGILQIP